VTHFTSISSGVLANLFLNFPEGTWVLNSERMLGKVSHAISEASLILNTRPADYEHCAPSRRHGDPSSFRQAGQSHSLLPLGEVFRSSERLDGFDI
jgi:hypothetical protein